MLHLLPQFCQVRIGFDQADEAVLVGVEFAEDAVDKRGGILLYQSGHLGFVDRPVTVGVDLAEHFLPHLGERGGTATADSTYHSNLLSCIYWMRPIGYALLNGSATDVPCEAVCARETTALQMITVVPGMRMPRKRTHGPRRDWRRRRSSGYESHFDV